METIPSPIHAGIFIGMWIFAGIRGGPFPRNLVALYSAFFILCDVTGYLASKNIIDFSVHAVVQCLLICAVYDYAITGRKIKAVNRFCYAMFGFMGIAIYAYLMSANYDRIPYLIYNTLLNVHNLISVILELYVIWLLVEIIDGARGDPIYKRLLAILFYGLSVFAPHREAFHYREEERDYR